VRWLLGVDCCLLALAFPAPALAGRRCLQRSPCRSRRSSSSGARAGTCPWKNACHHFKIMCHHFNKFARCTACKFTPYPRGLLEVSGSAFVGVIPCSAFATTSIRVDAEAEFWVLGYEPYAQMFAGRRAQTSQSYRRWMLVEPAFSARFGVWHARTSLALIGASAGAWIGSLRGSRRRQWAPQKGTAPGHIAAASIMCCKSSASIHLPSSVFLPATRVQQARPPIFFCVG
jgi:hypothetical protein